MSELNIYQKLLEVQKELKAPREVKGRFGNARSAEQILESAKPVCNKYGLYLMTSDTVSEVGGRNYITTTASVINVDKPEEIVEATACAWENEVSAGLDTSQVSGKTSSYGKKYALQNLLAIDDTKDADQEHTDPETKSNATVESDRQDLIKQITAVGIQLGYDIEFIDKKIAGINNMAEAHALLKTYKDLSKIEKSKTPKEPF